MSRRFDWPMEMRFIEERVYACLDPTLEQYGMKASCDLANTLSEHFEHLLAHVAEGNLDEMRKETPGEEPPEPDEEAIEEATAQDEGRLF